MDADAQDDANLALQLQQNLLLDLQDSDVNVASSVYEDPYLVTASPPRSPVCRKPVSSPLGDAGKPGDGKVHAASKLSNNGCCASIVQRVFPSSFLWKRRNQTSTHLCNFKM